MFGFFSPRHVKHGREMLKGAKKMLAYKRDLLRPQQIEAFEDGIGRLAAAVDAGNTAEIETTGTDLDSLFGKTFPPRTHEAIRENCEVFLVAIVIAIGVRTYFLQPFTIPTGSMQPTLNGILAYSTPTDQPTPNILMRILHFAVLGRTYVDMVSQEEDTIVTVTEHPFLRFFTVTEVECLHQRFKAFAPADKMQKDFDVRPGQRYRKGDVIAHGYVDTGDHVFVDKISYNFRNPHRGEVFVFSTANVATRENRNNPGAPSQFYIKRLAGLPNDVLRIDPPTLFVNGKRAEGAPFERVMAAKDGYNGYSNAPEGGFPFQFMGSPDAPFHVPDHSYFALGDNSLHSSDSRDWGVVPEQNLMGRGAFVYWPFTSHWGSIR